ncbi:MAG: ion channel [Synechococcus sp.]
MWFALVTLTTVGYGDRVPQSSSGRAIAGVWMVLSLVALSSVTAGLASAFTVSLSQQSSAAIDDVGDLRGMPVAVVQGTASEALARFYGARAKGALSLNEAVQQLQRQQVRAVMFDAVQLRYYLSQRPALPLKVANVSLAQDAYGFALPVGSELRTPINVQLIDMQRSGRITEITEQALR